MNYKDKKYYLESREELLKFYPTNIKRFLDVGYSLANFSEKLKSLSSVEVWGIEMNIKAATVAKTKIDKVLVGDLCEIIKIEGINREEGWKFKVLNILTFGLFSEFYYLQFLCVMKPI